MSSNLRRVRATIVVSFCLALAAGLLAVQPSPSARPSNVTRDVPAPRGGEPGLGRITPLAFLLAPRAGPVLTSQYGAITAEYAYLRWRWRVAEHAAYLRWQASLVPRFAIRDTRYANPVVAGSLYAAWTRVAVCEEGGWIGYSGYKFPDSLGIIRAAWFQFGGGSDVSPAAQIRVAENLIHHFGIGIPDQNGCAAW